MFLIIKKYVTIVQHKENKLAEYRKYQLREN